jgi:hypothetical protein
MRGLDHCLQTFGQHRPSVPRRSHLKHIYGGALEVFKKNRAKYPGNKTIGTSFAFPMCLFGTHFLRVT